MSIRIRLAWRYRFLSNGRAGGGFQPMQFDNGVGLVTGASRGIGRAIGVELAKRGAAVIVNYHTSAESAQEVVNAIKAAGGQAAAVRADVSRTAQAETVVQAAVEQFGKIDILINNAGIARDTMILRMEEADWDVVINTNLKSAWNCSKAAVKAMMRKRYGRIINITSVSGIAGQAGNINYSASKPPLITLTPTLPRKLPS